MIPTTFRFVATSKRGTAPVRGRIELFVDADSHEHAEELVRDSLPGFDWETWGSLYGPVAVSYGEGVQA